MQSGGIQRLPASTGHRSRPDGSEAWEIYTLRQSLSQTIGDRDAQEMQITLTRLGLGAGSGRGGSALFSAECISRRRCVRT